MTVVLSALLGLLLAVALVVVLRPQRRRPSRVMEERNRQVQPPRIAWSSPYAALERIASRFRRRRQRQRDATAGKYEIRPFLRGDAGQPDLQAHENDPQAARTSAVVPCLPR